MEKAVMVTMVLFLLVASDLIFYNLQAQKANNQMVIDRLLEKYRKQGAKDFDSGRAMALWDQGMEGRKKTCIDCHDTDLTRPGRHNRTGKVIDPMAAWLVPSRYTSEKKTEKWFKQNCNGTWGRDCTPQEKGDFLTWFRAPHKDKR